MARAYRQEEGRMSPRGLYKLTIWSIVAELTGKNRGQCRV